MPAGLGDFHHVRNWKVRRISRQECLLYKTSTGFDDEVALGKAVIKCGGFMSKLGHSAK